MSNQIGRISGPLLKDNLVRDGIDLAFETDLLYLDVSNDRIGMKDSSPSRQLTIDQNAKTINLIVDDLISTPRIEIDDEDNISSTLDKIYLDAVANINVSGLKTQNLILNKNEIYSYTTDSDIEIRPTRDFIIGSSVDITGSLHSTGDITFEGNITFGNNNLDNVDFNADVSSDLIPDLDNFYSLGETGVPNKRWKDMHSKSLSGGLLVVDNLITPANIDYTLRTTNLYYVSKNGNNSNDGNHYNSPFATIKHALNVASAGDSILIFPGEYEEEFPLTVPTGVSVIGHNIRNTIIKPTTETSINNAFLMNGETLISDITIRDFYYDNVNDVGYAFGFADNFSVSSRSPYVLNSSVITKGSVVTESDPRGFNEGDAGRGALVDGSRAMSTSNEASMLFHSVTFITPNTKSLVMRNGVRVEWLNSFTYFADIGLFAEQGVDGFAEQGIRFGAEVRSIGSANVYGTYGTVADGANTLMYLIQHNFGYIGSGSDSSNDSTKTIQINETVELNSGKIYYTSQAENGDFRVGDSFEVSFAKGGVSFDTSNVAIDGLSTIFIQGDLDRTIISADRIELGDFEISGNRIQTLSRSFDILAASGQTLFENNTYIEKNLQITNDFEISGTVITLGNQPEDTVQINTNLTQDIYPKVDNLYNIGSVDKNWKSVFSNEAVIDNVRIYENKFFPISSDSDLEFNSNLKTYLNNVYFSNNKIGTRDSNKDLKLTTDYSVELKDTSAAILPRTNVTLDRLGEMRFSPSAQFFQGFSTALVNLGGVYSSDRLSSVLASSSDSLLFTVNQNTTTTVDSQKLETNFLTVDQISLNQNIFTANTDLILSADTVGLDRIDFTESTLTSTALAPNLQLGTTGPSGYVVFSGTSALAVTYGDNSERPVNPEIGNTRFNDELGYLEVWDGTNWIPASGTGELSTFEYANEQTTLWALVVG